MKKLAFAVALFGLMATAWAATCFVCNGNPRCVNGRLEWHQRPGRTLSCPNSGANC